jgi:hypothetical protein
MCFIFAVFALLAITEARLNVGLLRNTFPLGLRLFDLNYLAMLADIFDGTEGVYAWPRISGDFLRSKLLRELLICPDMVALLGFDWEPELF